MWTNIRDRSSYESGASKHEIIAHFVFGRMAAQPWSRANRGEQYQSGVYTCCIMHVEHACDLCAAEEEHGA